ncbi:MAG: YtoQ family protein [Gammaproteobacteria bacterium]
MTDKTWNIYLSGEIHSDWRERIVDGANAESLAVNFSAPVTDHDASDMCGVRILGDEANSFWRDRKGASINAIRTSSLINNADAVIVRFGPKYKQWNAAFDAGFAAALNKPLIVLHDDDHDHALKEVDAAANATARSPEQVVEILRYVMGA